MGNLSHLASCLLPSLLSTSPASTYEALAPPESVIVLDNEACEQLQNRLCHAESPETLQLLKAAWSLVLKAYTGYEQVCFRITNSATEGEICYAHFTESTTGRLLLRSVIDNLGNADHRHVANTALYDGYRGDLTEKAELPHDIDVQVRTCHDKNGVVQSTILEYKHNALSDDQAASIARTLRQAISELVQWPDKPVHELTLCSHEDADQMDDWNAALGRDSSWIADTVHDRILRRGRDSADQAVSAWDGDLTYGELDRQSACVASRLISIGIGPETFIPLCFEKSRMVVVALLAVMRAGAAFVLLDPSHPIDRLQKICNAVSAPLVICSSGYAALSRQLANDILPLGNDLSSISEPLPVPASRCAPNNALYAVFTSGSTGEPKCAVIEHGAFCTSTERSATALKLGPHIRRLQFASHSFTMCNREFLTTLLVRGCICIPSEEDRVGDLAGFINRHRVNYVHLTPSVSGLLSPSAVPTVRVLSVGGESIGRSHLAKWVDKIELIYGYGASETAGAAAVAHVPNADWDPHNIGHSPDSALWVVDPDNHNRLAPIGAVGELLIQGPGLARHYLNNEERTRRQFLERVDWQPQPRKSRLYRTGDLARYNLDGSIYYIGRRDSQIKVNGQLVVLADIEDYIRNCPDLGVHAVAVIARSSEAGDSGQENKQLTAFVQRAESSETKAMDMGVIPEDLSRPWIKRLEGYLTSVLPRFMVPVHFIFMKRMPLTKSGKLDRVQLMTLSPNLSTSSDQSAPETPMTSEEHVLQVMWAETLNTRPPGQHDDFFRMGGDSLLAIKMVSKLRDAGLTLTVADIFQRRTLAGVALAIVKLDPEHVSTAPEPCSLIDDERVRMAVTDELGIDRSLIEDIYPCTPMQEGLVALSTKSHGAYIARLCWRLPDHIDIQRFRAAWATVWSLNPILRTRIARLDQSMFQVVLRHEIPWDMLEEHDQTSLISVEHGPLVRFMITGGARPCFRISIHHAIFDAWSLNLLLEQVEEEYRGKHIPTHPFNSFVQHISARSSSMSEQFWRDQFAGFSGSSFPDNHQSAVGRVKALATLTHSIEVKEQSEVQFTKQSALRLAWAMVTSQETSSADVVFGAVVTGRSAAMPGIDRVSGPVLSTVPVRVQLNGSDSVQKALSNVQEQSTRMIEHEQVGLKRIRQLGPEAAAACDLQNVLIIQNRDRPAPMRSGLFEHLATTDEDYLLPFANYPFQLICELEGHRLAIKASFDSEAISKDDTQRILRQLGHIYRQLLVNQDQKLGDIDLVPSEDLAKLKIWNSHVPARSHVTIHELIQARCRANPNSLAVCGRDLQLTYADLDIHASRLASALVSKGVQRGHIVPILYEKCPWATVAMLAVLKTGAAFVMLPSSYPVQRSKQIVSVADAQRVISSPKCAKISFELQAEIIIFPGSFTDTPSPVTPLPQVEPSDPAFVLFTSGSTGKPKGIVNSHSAISTSAENICSPLQLTSASRVLQISSYAFDVATDETLLSLVVGACICVPTEFERENDPTKGARDMQVNWVFSTPSMMRLLNPAEIPTLKTMVVGGEPLPRDLVCAWEPYVDIIQVYGPAECRLVPTLQPNVRSDSDPRKVGPPTGSATWIVDPNDHNRLLPIDAIGEVVLEGATTALGYLKDPEQTAARFIQCPPWLARLRAPSHPGPLYKTGDMGRFSADGSLIFLGRKDLQVKFHGVRIELGEIEQQIKALCNDVKEAIVEVVHSRSQNNMKRLVAFIQPRSGMDWGHSGDPQQCPVVESPSDKFFDDTATLHSDLARSLPRQMLPSLYVPLGLIPYTASGKADRRLLREEVSSWSEDQTLVYSRQGEDTEVFLPPTTDSGRILQRLVAKVLGRAPETVSMASDFFDIGGDSITATLLTASARREGLRTIVQDILKHRILSEIAENSARLLPKQDRQRSIHRHPAHETTVIRAQKLRGLVAEVLKLQEKEVTMDSNFFALGGNPTAAGKLLLLARQQGIPLTDDILSEHPVISDMITAVGPMSGSYEFSQKLQNAGIDATLYLSLLSKQLSKEDMQNIVDVTPMTEFQRFSHEVMNYRHYRVHLHPQFDHDRLLGACQDLVRHHSIFRTGFVMENGVGLQVTFCSWDVQFHEHSVNDLDKHCIEDCVVAESPCSGKPPFQLQLVTLPDSRVFLVFRLSHALWDIHSLRIIADDLSDLYNGQPPPPTSDFSEYVRASLDLRGENAYDTWRSVLEGSQVTYLTSKTLPVPAESSQQEAEYLASASKVIPMISVPRQVTLSTLLKAAWAVTLRYVFPSQPHNSAPQKQFLKDVVFGQVVLARDLGIPQEDRIVGPCLSFAPVRVHFDPAAKTSKLSLLQQVQQQLIETMPFATLGFRHIAENCTSWPSSTTFPSYVRIQNYDYQATCWLDGVQCDGTQGGLPNKPTQSANVHVHPMKDELCIGISVSNRVLGPAQVQYVVDCFCRAIQSFDSACVEESPDVTSPI